MVQTKLIENELDKPYKCCELYKTRTNVVWSRGTRDKDVDILFIGEGPGKDEDLQGKPFVGRAGKILDKWIHEADISSYAIINIVKCRPPNNRPPNKIEIRSCFPHLIRQIKEFNPRLIVALGRTACSVLINKSEIIANLGKIFDTKYGKVMVFPHPAYLLRGISAHIPIEELKNTLKELGNKCQKN